MRNEVPRRVGINGLIAMLGLLAGACGADHAESNLPWTGCQGVELEGAVCSQGLWLCLKGIDAEGACCDAVGCGQMDAEAGMQASSAPMAGSPAGGVTPSGAQDAGYFRLLVETGQVPSPGSISVEGFFAEHDTKLPEPSTDVSLTLHPLLGFFNPPKTTGGSHALLQIGINSHIDFGALPVLPRSMCVVLDRSGSMSGEDRIGHARLGLQLMVDVLGDADTLSIVVYSDTAAVLVEPTQVGGNRESIKEAIAGVEASGSTNLHGGMMLGYQQVALSFLDDGLNRLVLVTDGMANQGITEHATILEHSKAYNDMGIGITAIGVGTEFNNDLMYDLSRQGNGNYYFLTDSEKVKTVFVEEVQYFTRPIAEELSLGFSLDEGIGIEAVHGFALETDAAGLPGFVVPTVFPSARGGAILVEVDIPTEKVVSGEIELGEVHFSYRMFGASEPESVVVPLALPATTGSDGELYFYTDDQIHKNHVLLTLVKGMVRACTAFHGGDVENALLALDTAIAYAESENAELGFAEIGVEIALAKKLRSNVESGGGALAP